MSEYLNPNDRGKRQSHWATRLSSQRVHDGDGKRLGADHHFRRVLFKALEVLHERQFARYSRSRRGAARFYTPVFHPSKEEPDGQADACAYHSDYSESRGGPPTRSFVLM